MSNGGAIEGNVLRLTKGYGKMGEKMRNRVRLRESTD